MIEDKVKEFQETFNPLKFYARLRDLDIEKEEARRMSEIYEIGIYSQIIKLIRKEND